MEIEIKQDSILTQFDTGGGTRELHAVITIDETLSPRQKRSVAIFETLGCLLSYVVTKEIREEITGLLVDVLDQLEPLGVEE